MPSLVIQCSFSVDYVKPLDDDRALSELALPQMKITMHVLIIRYTRDRTAGTCR